MRPPIPLAVPGRFMRRERARSIHAFHAAAFWLAAAAPFFAFPIAWILAGNPASALAASAAALAFSALIACTITDLMSMRIPDGISALPLAAAGLWWAAVGMGFDAGAGEGVARNVFSWIAPNAGTGSIVPNPWPEGLGFEIAASFAAAALVAVPLVGSFVIGAMGGGDVKFIPPFALYLGWSLAFDLLFLTFLFGGVFALGMILARRGAGVFSRARPGRYPELERFSRMRHLAYAPAIAAAGVVCLAAKWEGIFG